MNREHPFERRLVEQWPIDSWRDAHVVLAVSSGPDSVAMLRAILAVKGACGGRGQVFVAHLNHGLRGPESDADQAWLESLCRRLKIPLEIGRADVAAIAAAQGDGLEAAAREARYRFLQQTAEKLGARYVATAHTSDDQVETILHRILRGTGLAGLAGMPLSRRLSPSVTLMRPLLDTTRAAVLEYLAAIDQDYRLDPSNADLRQTRNRLRHELLPHLRERYNAGVDHALLRLAEQAGETQQLITELREKLAAECVTVEFPTPRAAEALAIRMEIDCSPLADVAPLIVREVCKTAWAQANWPMQPMGYEAWQQLADLVQGRQHTAINLPGNIRAHRENQRLSLERAE